MHESNRTESECQSISANDLSKAALLAGIDEQSVARELERVLASEVFATSKRLPAFLRFITEKTLNGEAQDLKERTIGIEVFKRAPDYDCSDSPVVRVAAAQLRKRLGRYYEELGRENEIRISLPLGSYIPTFQRVQLSTVDSGESGEDDHESVVSIQSKDIAHQRSRPHWISWYGYLAFFVFLGVTAFAAVFLRGATRSDVTEQFWNPVLSSKGDVALCFAQGWGGATLSQGVVPTDVQAMNMIRDSLNSRKQGIQLVDLSATDPTNLRSQSIVYLGPFSQPWFKQVTDSLRYRIVRDGRTATAWIEDRQAPSQHLWSDSLGARVDRSQTHGILARFVDKTSHQLVVLASGISPEGTVAAGELMTNPEYAKLLFQGAPKDWQNLNLEAVIGTDIINGKAAGVPRVETVYFWN